MERKVRGFLAFNASQPPRTSAVLKTRILDSRTCLARCQNKRLPGFINEALRPRVRHASTTLHTQSVPVTPASGIHVEL